MFENRKRRRLSTPSSVPLGSMYKCTRHALVLADWWCTKPSRRAPRDNDLFNYMHGFAQVQPAWLHSAVPRRPLVFPLRLDSPSCILSHLGAIDEAWESILETISRQRGKRKIYLTQKNTLLYKRNPLEAIFSIKEKYFFRCYRSVYIKNCR